VGFADRWHKFRRRLLKPDFHVGGGNTSTPQNISSAACVAEVPRPEDSGWANMMDVCLP
jgi:hypothetical protein